MSPLQRPAVARLGPLLLAFVVVLAPAPCARAADGDEQPQLEFFYPLVMGRPVIERELELNLAHEKGREGRETEAALALELPLQPWWQIELEVPVVVRDPRHDDTMAGLGDIELENKFRLFTSIQHRALLAAGVALRFPTGSEERGLGGEASVEPFVRGAIALGDVDVLAEVAYEANINSHVPGEHAQELTAGIAAGYRLTRRFTPLLELTTVRRVRGEDEEDGPRLLDRTQVYLTPGFNVRPAPGTTVRVGIELPLTHAREFDYTLRLGVVKEF